MGILLKTTTVAGVVGAVYGTTSFDGGFDSDEAFAVTSSLVLSTATTVGLNIANAKLDKDIADKYATAMVEGMSDDQWNLYAQSRGDRLQRYIGWTAEQALRML